MIYGTDMGGFASSFVHRRLLRAAKGFVTGGPLGAVGGFVSTPRPTPSRTTTARPGPVSAAEKEAGRIAKFAETTANRIGFAVPCGSGFTRDRLGNCVSAVTRVPGLRGALQRLAPGGATGFEVTEPTLGGTAVGQAVMGRFGAAYFPGSKIIDRAICLPGDVVALDGLCYPKATLRVRERAWPPGRKPLLTGGDMRAISTAARAGRRLELASKRLQKIGLMKKPPPRRKLLTSGPEVHHHHTEH